MAYCRYSIISLRNLIIPALETVTLENSQNYIKKVRHYMFAYYKFLRVYQEVLDLEKLVKNL